MINTEAQYKAAQEGIKKLQQESGVIYDRIYEYQQDITEYLKGKLLPKLSTLTWKLGYHAHSTGFTFWLEAEEWELKELQAIKENSYHYSAYFENFSVSQNDSEITLRADDNKNLSELLKVIEKHNLKVDMSAIETLRKELQEALTALEGI